MFSSPAPRPLLIVFACMAITCFCGCLTIEENYTFKKDGSGSMEYVVDMSAIADLMKGLPGGAEKSDDDGIKRMEMDDRLAALKAVPGVKKVKLKKEKDGFIQRLTFKFADVAALNKALGVLMPDSTDPDPHFFRWEQNTLVRENNAYNRGLGGEVGGDPQDSTGMANMLESMHYKYSFKFAEAVSDTKLADGMIKEAPSARQLKFSTDWNVISKDPHALDLRITLAR